MDTTRYFRKVIKIRADDSPNVRKAMQEIAEGKEPSPSTVPGVLTYPEYRKRRLMWDKVRQCIGLDAEFYEGADALLYPPEWLNLAEHRAEAKRLTGTLRLARAIGVDPAEGGDKTAMSAVDEFGLIEQVAKPTPNTAIIGREIMAFAYKHRCPPHAVILDRGGGGKQIADQLRLQNFKVRTLPFGTPIVSEPRRRSKVRFDEKVEQKEGSYAYTDRRAEMYGITSSLLDPHIEHGAPRIGIPAEYVELRRQMSLIPKTYDEKGRLYILPKRKKRKNRPEEPTLEEILGCSPDELDSFVLGIWGMTNPAGPTIIKTMW